MRSASPSIDVRWFEEPVSSDDLEGLRLLRDRVPAGMEIAAGEYGYTLPYFEQMLVAGAVDCLQADATRCEGITGFLRVARSAKRARSSFRALWPVDSRPSLLCDRAAASSRVLPRPRPCRGVVV